LVAYRGPIVDAHHHVWEPALGKQPWLLPDAHIPFRYGDYESIKREFLPPDLLRAAEGLNLVGSVSMETEWNLDDPIGEMQYTEAVAAKYGLPTASVAHAVLREPAIEPILERLSNFNSVRAVRNKPGGARSRDEAWSNPSLLGDPEWQRGYSLLERYGLDFELQVPWWHFGEASELATKFPATKITINHTGLPSDRSAAGLAGWKSALARMARHDNVVLKISGIGVQGVPWTTEGNREVVLSAADIFGLDRIMFASNFPVDSIVATYREIFDGFAEIAGDWSPAEQLAAFAGNAVREYRLPPALLVD
jgi:predicted TIM-barrel fold metal-dependent hydrolase